ncbi:MAG TPA: hypothetical protein VES79_06780 [Solirubrobacteraceae bacterium]|nr:hypothetical protein [Solirubrobacteraceae bacterium]
MSTHVAPGAADIHLVWFRARSDQTGFALIEVIASAAVLGLVTLAVYAGFDATMHSSGRERARAVASSLAEQDQERLRSFRPVDLANYSLPPRIVKVPAGTGVPYTVDSQVDWMNDAADGTQSCTSEANQEDYLRITSTVTSGIIGKQTKPVVQRSLVAPPVGAFRADEGTLVVQVTGKTAPITNLPVTIVQGATTVTDDTNTFGCAVFRYVPIGSYTVSFSRTGYVDPAGANVVTTSGTVSEGTVNVLSLKYDNAASVLATFDTAVPGPLAVPPGHATVPAPGVSPATLPSRAWSVSVEHGDIPATGARTYAPVAPAVAPSLAITADKLFPFTSAYGVYAGACKAANPQTLVPPIAPGFAKTPGGLAPGELLFPLKVRHPALNVKVMKGAVVVQSTATRRVTAQPTSGDCATQPKLILTTWTSAATDPNQGWATKATTPPVFDPGVPYGSYLVCADEGSNSGKRRRDIAVNVNSATGSTPLIINLNTGSDTGRCAL